MPTVNDVIAAIDREELIALALRLANIDSVVTQEAAVADAVHEWMKAEGFAPRKIGLLANRYNVLGSLRGSGGGYSLLFNSHLDTHVPNEADWVHEDPQIDEYHKGWIEGDLICGEGIVNDKGPMAAFLIAAKAIKKTEYALKGDILLASVIAETSHEPVDCAPGAIVETKDLGSRFLASHGGIADYVLVAEGTGFGLVWAEPGEFWYKITLRSTQPPFYTPYLPERTTLRASPNMIVGAAAVIEVLEAWAAEYQRNNTYRYDGGTMVPKAQIGGIRSGDPTRPILAPQLCSLYLDVRAAPHQDPLALRDELATVVASTGIPADVELYSFRRGYEAKNIDRLKDSVSRSHLETFGKPIGPANVEASSLWRDINIYNELGIPALTYGPRAANHAFKRALTIESLYQAACVYARIAIDLCSQQKKPQ